MRDEISILCIKSKHICLISEDVSMLLGLETKTAVSRTTSLPISNHSN